jgi:hypothetical protein
MSVMVAKAMSVLEEVAMTGKTFARILFAISISWCLADASAAAPAIGANVLRPADLRPQVELKRTPPKMQAPTIAAMRKFAKLTQRITDTATDQSWSAILTLQQMDATPAPGVSTSVRLFNLHAVDPQAVTFDPMFVKYGIVRVTASGLKANSVYLVACRIWATNFQPKGSLTVNDPNGFNPITLQSNPFSTDEPPPVAFVAPASGNVVITVKTDDTVAWYWDQCTLGTVN